MKLLSIENIEKKQGDVPIYYRKDYMALALFQKTLHHQEQINVDIEFSVEMEPTGNKKIDVKIGGDVDYPLMPLIHSLKKEIRHLESKGKIPW